MDITLRMSDHALTARAAAAAGIVLHHYQQMAGVGFSGVNFFVAPDLFQTEYVFGWLTILFFMISGFLAAQQQMQQAQMQRQQNGGLDMQTAQAVIQRAQQDAARDSGQTMGANVPV